jgi:hypothetical protein
MEITFRLLLLRAKSPVGNRQAESDRLSRNIGRRRHVFNLSPPPVGMAALELDFYS